MIRRLLPLSALLLAALVGLPSCSSSDTPPAGGGTDTGGTDTSTPGLEILVGSGSTVFSPKTLTIKAGQTVTWKWAGAGHSVTSGPATCVPDGKFDSTILGNGATFTQKFDTAGTVEYFCLPHCGSGMTGTIIVTP
ncbi:MAG: plastocyanin/azurin family copper-binding protein [Polyangiales bacterium]